MSKKLANAERVADEAIANLAAVLPALRYLAHDYPGGRESIDCLCRKIEADVARLRKELKGVPCNNLVVTANGHAHIVECANDTVRRAVVMECIEEGYEHRDESSNDSSLPRVAYFDWNPA